MTRWVLTVIALAVVSSGCKKKDPEAPTPDPVTEQPAPAPAKKAPVIAPVHFETASKTVADTETPVIDEAVTILKTTDWHLLVVGLSDASGDVDTNKVLSMERAQAVADLVLSKSGVSADRVSAHGIGEKLATATTVNERKVEFVFYAPKEGLTPKQIVVQSRVLEEDFRAKRGN